jgi:hypothetical protein
MDMQSFAIFLIFCVSMYVVGQLARASGRKSIRWVVTASVIGPLAIVLLYLADALHAVSKRLRA